MSLASGERVSARKLSERSHRKSGEAATTSKAGNNKANSEQEVATAYMTASQPPHSTRIRPMRPIKESTAVIRYERKTSKRFEAGITTTDPTPIIATAYMASSQPPRSPGIRSLQPAGESAEATPPKRKTSKIQLTASSSGGITIIPTIEEQICDAIKDYNKTILDEFPNSPQYQPTFTPQGWKDDYSNPWQRYEEVVLTAQIVMEKADEFDSTDLEDLYFEWFMLVEILFNIESVRKDRILELPDSETSIPKENEAVFIPHAASTPSRCQIRYGQYTEILKLCALLDEGTPTHTPTWLFHFHQLLDNIYNGLRSEMAQKSTGYFDLAAAMSRRDSYTGGAMLSWSKRQRMAKKYYSQTTWWVEAAQQGGKSFPRFVKKIKEEIEPNVLPEDFFTCRKEEEDKGKGKGKFTETPLKIETGAPIYTANTLKARLDEANAQQELEEAKAKQKLEKAKAKRDIEEAASPSPPKKPKETKPTFEELIRTMTPASPKKEEEVKKPLKPKPKPKAEGEGPSASKQSLLTPEEVATLYQVDPDLLTKILFQAGELKTVPMLEVTKPTKPLKSSLKQEVKPSKTAKKKVVIEKKHTKRRKSKHDKSPSSSSSSSEEESESDSQGLTSSSDRNTNKAFRDLFKKQTSPRQSTKAAASSATTKKTKVVAEMESSESRSHKDEDDNGESEETPTTTETETKTTETTESEESTRTRRRRTRPRVSASFLKELRQAIPKYDGTRSLQKLYNFVDKVNVYIRAKPDVTDEEIIDLVELKLKAHETTSPPDTNDV
ncbi:hypothetical protein HDU88_007315 [Geranomyces variabilis]|nr:hypothetical protein HDU88_007315 [Geranomyces variabilis]